MIKKTNNKNNYKKSSPDNIAANTNLSDNALPAEFKENSFKSDGSKNPKALLIIINYNGINFIGECLDSLYSQSYRDFQVIVADNNSKDGSVNFIRENYPQCEVLANWQNKGYGDAINKAVK
ncbi:MAG: glycosyltransferase family 2 protein, partial [Candidatus Humimicrobiaceae bacterium]